MQARPMGSRKDTEAVEGEVQMDGEGEGFVNMGTVKVIRSAILFWIFSSNAIFLPFTWI